MARYGMEDPEEYNGYYAKSTQATKKHKIIFAVIGIMIVALVVVAIVKAI